MALLFHGPSFESSTNALAVSAIVSTLLHSFAMDSLGNFHLNVTHGFGISREGPEVGRDDERDDDTILAWQEDCCTRP